MRVALSASFHWMRLELGDRLPELAPLLRVVERRFVGALRQADRQRGDPDAAAVEHLQRVDEALPFLAEQLVGRHAAVVEDDFARVAGAHAELVLFLAGRHARRPVFDDEGRDAAMSLRPVGHGDDDHHAADPAVGDERLGAVDHPRLALARGRRPHAGGVAAGAGFGEPPRAPHLAADEPRAETWLFCSSLPNIEM